MLKVNSQPVAAMVNNVQEEETHQCQVTMHSVNGSVLATSIA